jgi:hypothetical protein
VRFLSLGAVSTDPRESRHISMAPPESAGRLSIHCTVNTTVNTADASPDDETSDGRAGPAHDMDLVRRPVRLKHSIVSYDADKYRPLTEEVKSEYVSESRAMAGKLGGCGAAAPRNFF